MTVKGIQVPLVLNGVFHPTDLEEYLDFYPEYILQCETEEKKPLSFYAYLSTALAAIDQEQPNQLDAKMVLNSFIEYVGGLPSFYKKYEESFVRVQ